MSLNKKYINLLEEIALNGYKYKDPNRKGVTRMQIDDYRFEIDNERGKMPLITCKKTYPKLAFKELGLFLSGETDIREYWKRGVNFWDKDLARFNEANGTEGSPKLVGIYPDLMRAWINQDGKKVDQVVEMINTLRNNPVSTKKTITMWNPGTECVLTPCHAVIEFLYNPKTSTLSLKWSQHSVDAFLG